MLRDIYIVIDSSGSMNEMGKFHLLRNLCRYIIQQKIIDPAKYLNVNFHFLKLNSEISEISILDNEDIELILPNGSCNLNILLDFATSLLNRHSFLNLLLMSDGNVSNIEVMNFEKNTANLKKLRLLTVAIGADADHIKLSKISSNNKVYLPENIASAIEAIVWGGYEASVPPENVLQITLKSPDTVEDDWND